MPYEGPEAEVKALRDRAFGSASNGVVRLRDFHQGVVTTLGAQLLAHRGSPTNKHYFLKIPNIDLTDVGLPGLPIYFSYPEDVFEKYKLPLVMIRFDGFAPAMQRWHPNMTTYRVPAPGARLIQQSPPKYDRYVRAQQAPPYDLNYTIVIEARSRGVPGGQRSQVLAILQHVLSVYPPHCEVWVADSVGDLRNYYAEQSGGSPEDEIFDVSDRTIGFSLPLRVEGELDLHDAEEAQAVLQQQINVTPK